ncbi:hypothetical protein AGMMS49942_12050 [Spirochaetia bacterium]|nr:hypothetical protein AGMMS49942_12050 [Spirochaetia bacterium]
MVAYISRKKALVRLMLSFSLGAAVLTLAWEVLKGPRLGPHYDYLLTFMESAPVSGELLLIETRLPQPDIAGTIDAAPVDMVVEPAVAAQVVMTLAEMNAASLVIQAPLAPSTGLDPGSVPPEELRLRFEGEFFLVERNIRNLFEAIRLGFILPAEAERYVGELVNITTRGKDRLLGVLLPQDRQNRSPLEQASAVFGPDRADPGLRLWLPGGNLYFKPQPDWDGKIRRIAPLEHIVYAALKNRLETEPLPGALFFVPVTEGDFRRIPLAAFLEYEEADRELYRLLTAAESQGIYAELTPENYPGYLYEYARDVREELLREGDGDRKVRWLNARAKYLQSLEDFFTGPSEAKLVGGYEELIAAESLDVEGIRRITALRNELILTFRTLRDRYAALMGMRANLERTLSGSFCIMGAPDPDLETSALLANTLLSGFSLHPGDDRGTLCWSLLGLFIIMAGIALVGPWISLGVGLLLTAVLGAAFSYYFILTAIWMDPLIPLSAALAGLSFSFAFALLAKRRAAARLRRAYGSRMAPAYLNRLIRAGGPRPTETLPANAAIVAVREGNLSGIENRSSPREAARAAAAFREEVFRIAGRAGAVMTGFEGDLAMFALGSPQERQAMKKMKTLHPYVDGPGANSPAARAAELVVTTIKDGPPQAASWHFAIDTGICCFSWSPAAGLGAVGRAAVTARLFSTLCSRYKTRVLISGRVAEMLEEDPAGGLKKLGVVVDEESGEREEFYALGDE